MTAIWLAAAALAQQYGFPTSAADYGYYYPTAYWDHGGYTDWNCGDITYGGHRGTDLGGGSWAGMDAGRDVTAAAPGVVTATNDGEFDRCETADCPGGGGFGNYVYVQHADGHETIYGHLKAWSVLVAVGDEVDCGTKLGEMGSSGHSTGPHLHFQVNDLARSSTDPFAGACDPGTSQWVDQGVWDGLPVLDCDTSWPGCQPVGTLACGDVLDLANDAPGSTSVHAYWGCIDYADYTGPELSWRFATDLDEPVTVRLTGLTGDLDLFVIDDPACDGRACAVASTNSASGDEEVVFDAVAGVERQVAVDGWEGAVSGFHLEVLCNGAFPGAGTGTGGTGTGAGTGAATGSTTGGGWPSDDTGDASDPEVIPGAKPLGCGCAVGSAPGAVGPLLGVVALAALTRRRPRR